MIIDNQIFGIENYFKDIYHTLTQEQSDKLKDNLKNNLHLTIALYYYISYKQGLTKSDSIQDNVVKDFAPIKIINNDYPFSHLLILIDVLAQATYISSATGNRAQYVGFINESIRNTLPLRVLSKAWVDIKNKPYHIACINWNKKVIEPLDSTISCCSDNIPVDLEITEDRNFDKCRENMSSNYESFACFLYKLRCSFAHHGVLASINMYHVFVDRGKDFPYNFNNPQPFGMTVPFYISLENIEAVFFRILLDKVA